jgi:hypothetical protein
LDIIFLITDVKYIYSRYPASVVSGLIRIGGLIAVVKILENIRLIHRSLFEK